MDGSAEAPSVLSLYPFRFQRRWRSPTPFGFRLAPPGARRVPNRSDSVYRLVSVYTSARQQFAWKERNGHVRASVAEPIEPKDDEPEYEKRFCHFCPKLYDFLAFAWDASTSRFAPLATVHSTVASAAPNPIEESWPRIDEELRKLGPTSPA